MVRLVLSCGGDPNLDKYSGKTIKDLIKSKEMKEFLEGNLFLFVLLLISGYFLSGKQMNSAIKFNVDSHSTMPSYNTVYPTKQTHTLMLCYF